ncbi:hypothetical protein BKN38_02915 [Helicobacter sp. CLO-3]|uniref:hypothetical protein n=1 Tax=unclassified Helicobacter TaxID=2593540 RepID=UPI0008053965|nr:MULTISPECIES: hypothetical protein [unclassified Helicobacter]OBV29563.1 hypothetical protein BA723_05085 [Helicobacter sp. CLO-3]OHU84550.1 hypothetical protein BKN38_02915 [Helicobacter sp. CLO-3]
MGLLRHFALSLLVFGALLCLVQTTAQADAIDDKIQELVGADSYARNKNFINNIFASKARFYLNNGAPNISTIANELKNNGLLVLKFPKPMELSVSFSADTSPSILSYTINNVLSSMGYSYFMISQASRIEGRSLVKFSFITEHALDPSILFGELQKRGFWLKDIARTSINEWAYTIEPRKAQLSNAKPINIGNSLTMREVSGQYWLNIISSRTASLKINAPAQWTPRIVCYDKNLEIINLIVEQTPKGALSVRIDERVAFVMISDALNPSVIKQIEVSLVP